MFNIMSTLDSLVVMHARCLIMSCTACNKKIHDDVVGNLGFYEVFESK